jgi:hypothetical protein
MSQRARRFLLKRHGFFSTSLSLAGGNRIGAFPYFSLVAVIATATSFQWEFLTVRDQSHTDQGH